MDIVIAGFGLYLAIAGFFMKKKCKDTKAYIAGVVPYMYFFGLVALVAGVIGILGDLEIVSLGRIWSFIELALFLGALVLFTHGLRGQKDKYFD